MPDTDRQLILSAARDALLAAFPNAWAIYVYGSFARSDESPASDIDLAVLLPQEENIDDLLGVVWPVRVRHMPPPVPVGGQTTTCRMRRFSRYLRRDHPHQP